MVIMRSARMILLGLFARAVSMGFPRGTSLYTLGRIGSVI